MDACKQAVIQNLWDAGCDRKTVEQFLFLEEAGELEKQLALLSDQRKKLLEKVHREERKITCLDYLVYQLEKLR